MWDTDNKQCQLVPSIGQQQGEDIEDAVLVMIKIILEQKPGGIEAESHLSLLLRTMGKDPKVNILAVLEEQRRGHVAGTEWTRR